MSHEISVNSKTGKEEMFSAVQPPWHGLGTVLDNPATAAEAIEAAGLDWDVDKRPLEFPLYDVRGNRIGMTEAPDTFGLVRRDTEEFLGTAGKDYTILQNKDIFSFFDPLVDEDEAVYHTAGALKGGQKIWIMAKLPAHIRVGKDDLVEQYVLLYNSHGGGSVVACVTPVRVVCNNTLTAALQGAKNRVSLRHTKNVEMSLRQAHEVLGISNRYKEEIEPIFNAMAGKQIVEKDIDSLFDSMSPDNPEEEVKVIKPKTREIIKEAFEQGIGQDLPTTKGTLFGFYNAVTYYVDHLRTCKTPDSRTAGIWFDVRHGLRQRAFDAAVDMIS